MLLRESVQECLGIAQIEITPKAIELQILHVKARIQFKNCLFAHKSLLKNLMERFPISSHCTSTFSRLVEPFLSRQFTIKRYFSHCAPCIYNQLSHELRTIDDLTTFKKKLKAYFFEKYMI